MKFLRIFRKTSTGEKRGFLMMSRIKRDVVIFLASVFAYHCFVNCICFETLFFYLKNMNKLIGEYKTHLTNVNEIFTNRYRSYKKLALNKFSENKLFLFFFLKSTNIIKHLFVSVVHSQ